MKSSLPAYVQTYSFGSRKAVSDLIVLAKNNSRSAASIAQSLEGLSSINQYNGLSIAPYALASFEAFLDFFRDINLKTIAYYDAMNQISTAISSYSSILNSEIAKLEKDINQLQIFIDNYSFLSGEDDLYNGSFVETFSDDSNSYLTENFQNKQYDKDGLEFSQDELASVDIVSGTLKCGSKFSNINVYPKITEYKNNYTQYISSSSDMYNLFNEASNKSWNTTIKSPTIISSNIDDLSDVGYDYSYSKGATASVNFVFENPQTMNCMRISPNLGTDFQILQVIVYTAINPNNAGSTGSSSSSSSEAKILLLQSPLLVESVKDISFDEVLVRKIKIIFNQPRYKKIVNTASIVEEQSKIIDYFVSETRKNRAQKHDRLQDLVYSYFLKRNEIASLSSNADYIPNYYSYRYPCEETNPTQGSIYEFLNSKNTFSELNDNTKLKNTNQLSKIVQSMVSYVLGDQYRMSPNSYVASQPTGSATNISSINFLASSSVGNIQSPHGTSRQDMDAYFDSGDRFDLIKTYSSLDNINYYEYNFSIKSVKFGTISQVSSQSSNLKSFFISKMIDTGGFINKLKIKSKYFMPKNSNESLDLKDGAAVEFSLTLNANASNDIDWIPILPNGERNVNAELLFPLDQTGLVKLRFPASLASLNVYEQGKLIDDTRIITVDSQVITSFKILNHNSSFTYVAQYTVNSGSNANEIDFSRQSIQNYTLRSYSSSDGLGEKLSTIGSENRIRLSYNPYIDYSKFVNHIYSPSVGTIGASGVSTYSPISIILEDGTPAINLTNYLPNKFVKYELPLNSDTETYFIQNGNSITFSKKASNFRVYYNYIPESLRYKIVIRNLDSSKQTSAYIDDFVLKYQQNNSDNFTNKLLKVI